MFRLSKSLSKSSTTFTKNFRRKHRRPICRESVSLDKNRGASYVCKKASSTRKRGRSSKKPSKTPSKNDSGIAFRRSRFGTDFGTKIHEESSQNRSKINFFDQLRSTWAASGSIFASWGRLGSLEAPRASPFEQTGLARVAQGRPSLRAGSPCPAAVLR